MAKKNASQSVDWKTPRFQGKSFCFAGRFEKYGRERCRDWLDRYVLSEGGKIVEKLTSDVSYLVMKEPTGTSAHEKKMAQLNAKGASIEVITGEQLRELFLPTNDEVIAMLLAGKKGWDRLHRWLGAAGHDSESFRHDPPPNVVRGISFRGEKLEGMPLWCLALENADFRDATVSEGEQATRLFSFGPLVNSKLDGAKLKAWFASFTNCSCRKADLSGGWLNFYQTQLCSGDFTSATMVGFHFSEADLSGSDFTKADLTKADLEKVTAKSLCFRGACLKSFIGKEANFTGSDFASADLSGANLVEANLEGCNFTGAKLCGAVLTGASLKGACLKGADFTDANVGQVNFEGADCSKTKGLETTTRQLHIGPKLKELSDRIQQADEFRSTIDLTTKTHPVRLAVSGGKQRRHRASWTKELWADTLTDWEQHTNSVADSFLAAVSSWPDATPLPNTVTAVGKKTGLVTTKLKQLALEAWCETFGITVPTAEEMQQLGQDAESQKNQERARLLSRLDAPDGVQQWNKPDRRDLVAVTSFPSSNLAGKQLDGLNLRNIEFENSNFEGASLVGAQLEFSAYRGSNFRRAKMSRLEGKWSKFDGCDFSDADLSNADLNRASLVRANFSNADLTDTNLQEANLRGTNFTNAKFSWKHASHVRNLTGAEFDETTIFPADFELPKSLSWKGKDIDPRAKSAVQAIQSAGPLDLQQFMTVLEALVDKDRLAKALAMLKADRFRLFAQTDDEQLLGVVKSQSDPDLVYSCRLTKEGEFACCTQNLNVCGGLRGALCKHLLVLIIGMTNGGELDPTIVNQWITASRFKKPVLDKDVMSETLLRYKGAEAGEVDWRPMETIPEDYYAL